MVYYISKGHLEAVQKLFSLRVEECTSTSGELLQYRCIVFVACWGVALLSIMLPIYISGANMYECGSSFHRSTVAYLYGATELEWLVGVLGCVFTCAVICTLLLLRAKLLRDCPAMTIFYLNIACMGKFIPLWSRCGNEPGSFDLSYGMRVVGELRRGSHSLIDSETQRLFYAARRSCPPICVCVCVCVEKAPPQPHTMPAFLVSCNWKSYFL